MSEKSIVKALSLRQPWPWLILYGGKDIENRSWATKFRGRVWIHAGATMTQDDYAAAMIFISTMKTEWRVPSYKQMREQCGGIVGSVEIAGCVAASESPWFVGEFGFVLRNPQPKPFVRCKGKLGFFTI